MRAIIDTHVFVSGIFWAGNSHEVILSWKEGRFALITSLKTIAEVVAVLKDFKIRLPDDVIWGWVDLIVRNSIVVEPKEKIDIVREDPKDNMLIEAAIAGNADYIVSQDKHLLKLKEVMGVKIVTPEEFNKICPR